MSPQPLHIAALDVGHADCSVVYTGTRSTALVIDCGDADTLLDFLRSEGLHRVTVALVTHNDHDHVRGMADLLANYPVDCIALHPTIRHLGGIPNRTLAFLLQTIQTA